MTLREQILGAMDLQLEAMVVPEWSTSVYVRGLTLAERTKIADEANGMNGATDAQKTSVLTRRLVQYGVCDSLGASLFGDEDFDSLAQKNANVLDRIGLRVSALSKLGEKDVKELEKNSDPTQTVDSASS